MLSVSCRFTVLFHSYFLSLWLHQWPILSFSASSPISLCQHFYAIVFWFSFIFLHNLSLVVVSTCWNFIEFLQTALSLLLTTSYVLSKCPNLVLPLVSLDGFTRFHIDLFYVFLILLHQLVHVSRLSTIAGTNVSPKNITWILYSLPPPLDSSPIIFTSAAIPLTFVCLKEKIRIP